MGIEQRTFNATGQDYMGRREAAVHMRNTDAAKEKVQNEGLKVD
jgi:hypothetical protein